MRVSERIRYLLTQFPDNVGLYVGRDGQDSYARMKPQISDVILAAIFSADAVEVDVATVDPGRASRLYFTEPGDLGMVLGLEVGFVVMQRNVDTTEAQNDLLLGRLRLRATGPGGHAPVAWIEDIGDDRGYEKEYR